MFFKLKRSKADILFSSFIRERDDWTCQKCRLPCHDNRGYLDCSHYFSRAKKSVRFDPSNAMSACKKCHDYLGKFENRGEHEAIFLRRLGKIEFDLLTVRAQTPQKVDEEMICLWLEGELKKIRENRQVLK